MIRLAIIAVMHADMIKMPIASLSFGKMIKNT